MKKLKLSKIERRILIILVSINLIAFLSNRFELSPKFNSGSDEIFLLTDSKEERLFSGEIRQDSNGVITRNTDGSSQMYKYRHPKHFWPFTMFIDEKLSYDSNLEIRRHTSTRFRGLFPDFDLSEFLVYNLLIFGIIFIRKLW